MLMISRYLCHWRGRYEGEGQGKSRGNVRERFHDHLTVSMAPHHDAPPRNFGNGPDHSQVKRCQDVLIWAQGQLAIAHDQLQIEDEAARTRRMSRAEGEKVSEHRE
jgi:hypothetical protein